MIKKLLATGAALCLAPTAPATATPAAPMQPAEVQIFASGGTPLTNGIFYPGTIVEVGGAKYGTPLEVPQGSNISFTNTDPEVVANTHCLVSVKRNKRTRQPLFASKCIKGPAQDRVVTSHLKPGIYEFFCPIHFGMLGAIEVSG